VFGNIGSIGKWDEPEFIFDDLNRLLRGKGGHLVAQLLKLEQERRRQQVWKKDVIKIMFGRKFFSVRTDELDR
jgi:hypothetical protein